ncbi:unnamed protein product [Ectocarpus sp. 12 AP-2014]
MMLRHTKPGKIVTKAPGSHIWRHIHLTSRNFSCFRPLQRRLVLPRTFVTRPETDDTHTRVHVDDNSWIGLTDSSDYSELNWHRVSHCVVDKRVSQLLATVRL